MGDSIAEEMGKQRAADIQKRLKQSDFSKCDVPIIPEALGYLVDGMSILVEAKKENGDRKMGLGFGKFRLNFCGFKATDIVLIVMTLLVAWALINKHLVEAKLEKVEATKVTKNEQR